jgi:hypothetical protein
MIKEAFKLMLVIIAMTALASCSTEPAIRGEWRRPDERLVFRKDGTFIYELGIGNYNIRHQDWSGKYQFSDPEHIELSDVYFGRTGSSKDTNMIIVWKVSIRNSALTTTGTDGSEQRWERFQK